MPQAQRIPLFDIEGLVEIFVDFLCRCWARLGGKDQQGEQDECGHCFQHDILLSVGIILPSPMYTKSNPILFPTGRAFAYRNPP
jgi:hypothetical protein